MHTAEESDGLQVQSIEHFRNSDHLPQLIKHDATQNATGTAKADIHHNCSSKTLQGVHLQRHNPFGLSPLAFGALVALMTTLIVSAAVGGGLGAALPRERHCDVVASSAPSTSSLKPSQSLSPTSNTPTVLVNYVVPEPTLIQTLYNDCPTLNDTVILDTEDQQYRVACGRRLLGGVDTTTLSELVAYSLQDCIQACTLLNAWSGGLKCSAVTWDTAMAYSYEVNIGGNCWLFDNASSISLNDNTTTAILEQ
jgi:hypothetical protein